MIAVGAPLFQQYTEVGLLASDQAPDGVAIASSGQLLLVTISLEGKRLSAGYKHSQ